MNVIHQPKQVAIRLRVPCPSPESGRSVVHPVGAPMRGCAECEYEGYHLSEEEWYDIIAMTDISDFVHYSDSAPGMRTQYPHFLFVKDGRVSSVPALGARVRGIGIKPPTSIPL